MQSGIGHYTETSRADFESRLKESVEIPTISAEPEHRSDIDRGAESSPGRSWRGWEGGECAGS